jgi:hypothetical protein
MGTESFPVVKWTQLCADQPPLSGTDAEEWVGAIPLAACPLCQYTHVTGWPFPLLHISQDSEYIWSDLLLRYVAVTCTQWVTWYACAIVETSAKQCLPYLINNTKPIHNAQESLIITAFWNVMPSSKAGCQRFGTKKNCCHHLASPIN